MSRRSGLCPMGRPTPARASGPAARRTAATYAAPVLHVHRSDRADVLVGALARLVAVPLDPITPEVVSVPTRGIERWLTQQLSSYLGTSPGRGDGVCANIEFPFPGSLVNGALARAAEVDPRSDPWLPERAAWPLMEVVEAHLADPWLAPLARHMEESARFSSVRHVADLFDRYAVHRPDMVQRWSEGDRREGETLWQYELWRILRQRIGQASPAERLREACDRLRAEPGMIDAPERVSLFGLTRLPASYLDVLEAVAAGRDVHLFLLHPSPALWDRLAGVIGPGSRHTLRRDDPTARAPRHPLLSSWGRDAREMQLVLGGALAHGEGAAAAPLTGGATLLHRIQEDIRADRAPLGSSASGAEERPALDPDDDSIRIHSCHGRGRQVEVLRDALLHLFEDDPDLEPRDVIVMCPDIETFAPLIEAGFGAHDRSDVARLGPGQLEIRLADRSLRQTNPVLGVVAEVLELASARDHRLPAARPGRARARPASVPPGRRRPGPAGGVGAPGGDPLGVRCPTPRDVPAGFGGRQHVARRARPPPPGCRHGRRARAALRRHPAARRRGERRHRAGRPAGRARRAPAAGRGPPGGRAHGGRVGARPDLDRRRAHGDPGPGGVATGRADRSAGRPGRGGHRERAGEPRGALV